MSFSMSFWNCLKFRSDLSLAEGALAGRFRTVSSLLALDWRFNVEEETCESALAGRFNTRPAALSALPECLAALN
jgi:hypothetical protein